MNRSIYGLQGCEDADSWAAWFDGKGFLTGGIWFPSDDMLKTNVQEIASVSEVLMQLKPKSYYYQVDAFSAMKLPTSLQYGLIAQDLQEVLPNLVIDTFHPGELDDEGSPIGEGFNFKAINYTELTPILIAGHQEQQVTIDALKAEIEAMKAQIAECCAKATDKSSTGSNSTGSFTELADFDLNIEKATLDQNVPNPFQNETSITYRIPAQAMVRARILGQSGQQIDTLVDGLMPRGEYRIIWNASHLPAGMYYYTLEADGVELVKKAVKL